MTKAQLLEIAIELIRDAYCESELREMVQDDGTDPTYRELAKIALQ
jgi:hypothetical protein